MWRGLLRRARNWVATYLSDVANAQENEQAYYSLLADRCGSLTHGKREAAWTAVVLYRFAT
jgi:hypothetical protein